MVRFEDKKLVIEIETHGKNGALEAWMDLQRSLCDIIRNTKDDTIYGTFHSIPDFIGNLLPDWEDAKKMIK